MSEVSPVGQHSLIFLEIVISEGSGCGEEGKTDKYSMNAAVSRLMMLLFINISTAYLMYQSCS